MQKNNPYTFISFSGGAAIKCNIKSVNDGFLYPLDKGLFFIQKFLFIKKSEVAAARVCMHIRGIAALPPRATRFDRFAAGARCR